MEITLEQIELVKDRTGASYKEAKEALEFTNGNVVDAIIYIEENISYEYDEQSEKGIAAVIESIKNIVRLGNVTKIRIYKGEELILNLPVTAGAAAAVLFPWGVITAAVASASLGCKIEIFKENGDVVSINDKAGKVVNVVKDKGSNIVDDIKNKGGNIYSQAVEKGSGLYNQAVEKGSEIYENAKNKVAEYIDKVREDKTGCTENCEEAPLDGTGEFCDSEDNK